jgi:hypothetical protein
VPSRWGGVRQARQRDSTANAGSVRSRVREPPSPARHRRGTGQADTRYTPTMHATMYIDSATGAILAQLLFLVVVVALLIWLLGRATRRR